MHSKNRDSTIRELDRLLDDARRNPSAEKPVALVTCRWNDELGRFEPIAQPATPADELAAEVSRG